MHNTSYSRTYLILWFRPALSQVPNKDIRRKLCLLLHVPSDRLMFFVELLRSYLEFGQFSLRTSLLWLTAYLQANTFLTLLSSFLEYVLLLPRSHVPTQLHLAFLVLRAKKLVQGSRSLSVCICVTLCPARIQHVQFLLILRSYIQRNGEQSIPMQSPRKL
jgi:hypothetical protein